MTTTGIIAEFNPFHTGHKFLLSQAGQTAVVVAMSGNWMQRGEPTWVDKWTRAGMALKNGADLVVELPLMVSLQGADFFAAGAVDILSKLGCDELLFGTEDGTTNYERLRKIYTEKSGEMSQYIDGLPDEMTYPQKAEKAWEKFAGVTFDGETPNHILGLAYAKAASRTSMKLRTVKRDTGYNDQQAGEQFASATAIRGNESLIERFVPENARDLLKTVTKVTWADFYKALQVQIITSDLTSIFQMNDELANRLKRSVGVCGAFEELVEMVATRRYTKGYIRRLLCYILLQIPREFDLPEPIHVLGFTSRGKELLAKAREAEVPVVTKIGQHPWDALTQRGDTIYQLAKKGITEQNYGRKPIML
ncbi:MAG: nucleotidyltransferase [Streptococcaceae bacterium]|jgi:predicted nucleotidyltransferase|nr:nucleotidyltransferase [Streptococcaceae bacterium]